jgi:hypothetical protein
MALYLVERPSDSGVTKFNNVSAMIIEADDASTAKSLASIQKNGDGDWSVATDLTGPFRFAKPDADVSDSGSWGPVGAVGDLWPLMNEKSPIDTTYASDNPAGVDDFLEEGLANITAPSVNTGHIVRVRYRKSGVTTKDVEAHVELRQGAVVIAESTPRTLTVSGTWVDEVLELTTGEAGNITDYDDLRIRVVIDSLPDSGPAPLLHVSWMELEVPVDHQNLEYRVRVGGSNGDIASVLYIAQSFDLVDDIGNGLVALLNNTPNISNASYDSATKILTIAGAADSLGDRNVSVEVLHPGLNQPLTSSPLIGTITDEGSSGDALTVVLNLTISDNVPGVSRVF